MEDRKSEVVIRPDPNEAQSQSIKNLANNLDEANGNIVFNVLCYKIDCDDNITVHIIENKYRGKIHQRVFKGV